MHHQGLAGEHCADINSRGAAIECYLDAGLSPVVWWNNFNKELGVYQGELVGKGDVMCRFYEPAVTRLDYDFSRNVRPTSTPDRLSGRTDWSRSGVNIQLQRRAPRS